MIRAKNTAFQKEHCGFASASDGPFFAKISNNNSLIDFTYSRLVDDTVILSQIIQILIDRVSEVNAEHRLHLTSKNQVYVCK